MLPNYVFYYISFLRPPPFNEGLQANDAALLITPQICNDLPTEYFENRFVDIYYTWSLHDSDVIAKPAKLTSWRTSTAYKGIPVSRPPLPATSDCPGIGRRQSEWLVGQLFHAAIDAAQTVAWECVQAQAGQLSVRARSVHEPGGMQVDISVKVVFTLFEGSGILKCRFNQTRDAVVMKSVKFRVEGMVQQGRAGFQVGLRLIQEWGCTLLCSVRT